MRPVVRAGLVVAVSLMTTIALALPVSGSPSSPAPSASWPPARDCPGVVYDAARGEVLMFGGETTGQALAEQALGDMWTWNGGSWTQLTPAHLPSPRYCMGIAYDAARAQVVLWGGYNRSVGYLTDTWTWNGTDWTQQFPAHSPPPSEPAMVYDGARQKIVLYTGWDPGETWTWNGSDWTQRLPAHSPPERSRMAMAYDAAHAQVVLFGGDGADGELNDTWTWNGTDWTQQTPLHNPSARFGMAMTYDTARGQVLLLGGGGTGGYLNDTWTWNGTDWTQQTPAHSPSPRAPGGLAFDAHRSEAVMFGGYSYVNLLDTWTWDGSDWTGYHLASLQRHPSSGPPGTEVRVKGAGFGGHESVRISFLDTTQGRIPLGEALTDPSTGSFNTLVWIPANATAGRQRIKAHGRQSGMVVMRSFSVT